MHNDNNNNNNNNNNNDDDNNNNNNTILTPFFVLHASCITIKFIDTNVDSPYKSTDAKSQRFVCGGCDNLVRFFRKDQTTGWVEEGKGTGAGHSDWVRDVAWR